MAEFDYSQAISDARTKYESIALALDTDRLKSQEAELEQQASALDCGMTPSTRRR